MLRKEYKQLLFDHSLNLTTESEAAQAEALIANNQEAEQIHSKLKFILAALDSIRDYLCPNDLAERTVWLLRQLAIARQKAREPVPARIISWRNFAQVGAIAASIFLVVGVLVPSLSFARHEYRKHICQNQLASIASYISAYCSDYDDMLPAVTTDMDWSWCNSRGQGGKNRSNNSNLYLLLKMGYCTRPQDFVCCKRYEKQLIPLKISQISKYNNFPKGDITYSYRIFCHQPVKLSKLAGQPLMADRNPLFERVQEGAFTVQLNDELCRRNSINHNRRGQNVLFSDGHASFLKTRDTGIPRDDIFTVQNLVEYGGDERPTCQKDYFLAP